MFADAPTGLLAQGERREGKSLVVALSILNLSLIALAWLLLLLPISLLALGVRTKRAWRSGARAMFSSGAP
ncbi:hypothetical protein [Caulobacter endophyticus]|uniref:Uncharacterized protein n=1 Tax=Caulobacter endophyticus TaxID=2172652 RepID=A0A2T9JEN4_9CAUL|nr:hypothetical protein [Caulobacter endophyticus]PVM82161.1 hypothetical protein DDF67_24465 [Caulobacter endophyticus]